MVLYSFIVTFISLISFPNKWNIRSLLLFFIFHFHWKNHIILLPFRGEISREAYSLALLSMQIVTGPSLMSATFMSAPKLPVATFRPSWADSLVQKKL